MEIASSQLDLLRGQREGQQHKLDKCNEDAEAAQGEGVHHPPSCLFAHNRSVAERRELLMQTIEPLKAELDKIHALMLGLSEAAS